ncbi:helix-turn-helix transcriptional regulator [uncultured Vibrio sp.]|uniref:helix-turn-helix domain-containing protein n=1 Tax=uncultured Vibrio sp. TaxID=114054 RepID=UPI0025D1AA0A|nr:helix-turn-helix transcriptional regulator [uncultured Vibrio sp.]
MATRTSEAKQTIPLVRRSDVQYFVSLFSDFDDDIYPLLRQALVPNDLLDTNVHYDFLPETTLKNLINILGSRLTNQDFGQLIADSCHSIYVPTFLSHLTKDKTLKDALDEFTVILSSASSNAHVYTKKAGGKWWLVRDKTESNELWFKYGEIFSVLFLCELLDSLTDGKWQPSEIGLQTSQDQEFRNLPNLHTAQFYCSRPTTALYIPDNILVSPVCLPKGSEQIIQPSIPHCESFLESFKLAIKPYISMGKLPIKLAAEILDMNVRTLQRRLKDESVLYGKVIEQLVLEQSLQLLKCDQVPITDVASKMGYSDSAHFTRAFKRLMHMTPREYKKTRLKADQ